MRNKSESEKRTAAGGAAVSLAVRLVGSTLLRLGKREISEPALKPCFLAPSALVTLAKSALGYERQVPKSIKNQGLRVFRVLREQIFCRRKGNFCSNMRYCKKISRSECGYLPLKTEFGYPPLAYPTVASVQVDPAM